MIDLCTQDKAFTLYMKRPNVSEIMKGSPYEAIKKRHEIAFDKILQQSKKLLKTEDKNT